jgi:hypothetical protein
MIEGRIHQVLIAIETQDASKFGVFDCIRSCACTIAHAKVSPEPQIFHNNVVGWNGFSGPSVELHEVRSNMPWSSEGVGRKHPIDHVSNNGIQWNPQLLVPKRWTSEDSGFMRQSLSDMKVSHKKRCLLPFYPINVSQPLEDAVNSPGAETLQELAP